MTVMNELSKEYGTAIFALACEENAKKEYARALEDVRKVFEEQPEYLHLISSPSIPLSERLTAIETAFATKVPENVLSYLQLMCQKGRIMLFLESIEHFNELFDASEQITTAKVTSAIPLTDEEKRKLSEKLERIYKKSIILDCFIDEAMLGGLIVEIDGNILDGSLRQRLREVKEVMNK